MLDFQVVFPQSLIKLSQVRYAPGIYPRTLDMIGEDFRSIDEILINGVPSPSIVVVSATRCLAQVPESILNDRVTSVTVVSRQLTISPKSLIRFRLGKSTTKVAGMLRLVQLFVKILLTTPGSDIFSKRVGGAGMRNLGRTFSTAQGSGLVADFVIAVDTTSKQIIALQAKDSTIPRDERLLSAKVLNASFNRQEGALIVGVEMMNQTGQTAIAQLMA